MYSLIHLTITSLTHNSSMIRSTLRCGFILTALALVLALFALPPIAQAADGGLPNENTAEGDSALSKLTNGVANTAVGFEALFSNTGGSQNTATGDGAIGSNTTGDYNTANGVDALLSNSTGSYNTANGGDALFSNVTGSYNTATGFEALLSNQTGINNTASGYFALKSNVGNDNTASGSGALTANNTGSGNTASGKEALQANTSGFNNTASGVRALTSAKTASANTATGAGALLNDINGFNNTADGVNALANNSSGSSNIAVGVNAGLNLTTGSNNIDIGNQGVAGEANKIRIGKKGTHKNTFIAGINGVTVAGGVGVIIDSNGQLGTVTSSARFKEAIKPMEKASEAILAFHPVTFRYKHELDPEGIPQFGLVAEQVKKVNPALVARDEEGKAYTVRYEAVNAMLLNEFLKEHRKVELQEARLRREEQQIAQQQKQIEALRQDLRQVSERLNEPGLQTVGNNY